MGDCLNFVGVDRKVKSLQYTCIHKLIVLNAKRFIHIKLGRDGILVSMVLRLRCIYLLCTKMMGLVDLFLNRNMTGGSHILGML